MSANGTKTDEQEDAISKKQENPMHHLNRILAFGENEDHGIRAFGSLMSAAVHTTRAIEDEENLDSICSYLKSKRNYYESLDEERVAAYTLSTHRLAYDRTRCRLGEDRDLFCDRINLYDRVYKEEEYHEVATNFLKESIAEASVLGPGMSIHSKTMLWIEEVSGLWRPYDTLKQHSYLAESEEEECDSPVRRMTRGIKQNRRKERMKRDYEGLVAIREAANEIEREREGSDDQFADGERHMLMGAMSPERSSQFRAHLRNDPPKSRLVATIGTTDQRDVRIRLVVKGRPVSGASKEEINEWRRAKKQRMDRERYYSQKKRSQLQDVGGEGVLAFSKATAIPCKKKTIHSESPHADNRNIQSQSLQNMAKARAGNPLRSSVIPRPGKAGTNEEESSEASPDNGDRLAHRAVESTIHQDTSDIRTSPPSPAIDPLNGPTRVSTRAAVTSKLFRFLRSRGRRWARHEFFLSTLDSGWYSSDSFSAKASKFFPMTTKLSRREWYAIRRHIKPPRRFSKNFIADELYKRNISRRELRKIQKSPNSKGLGVQTSVLRPGTSVLAYSKRYQIVQKATVLFHSPADKGCFVQFEGEQLGCEFCLDAEVSLHKRSRVFYQSNHELPISNENTGNLLDSSCSLSTCGLNDHYHECYSLIWLMTSIERAQSRKEAILDTAEEYNSFVTRDVKYSLCHDGCRCPLHRLDGWLLANLHISQMTQAAICDELNLFIGDL